MPEDTHTLQENKPDGVSVEVLAPKRVLIIKHGALGDFILSLGLMRGLRERYAGAELTLITMRGMVAIAEATGYFAEIIVDDRHSFVANPASWWRICYQVLAKREWDLIIDLQNSRRTQQRYFFLARVLACRPLSWVKYDENGSPTLYHVQKNCFGQWGKTTSEPFAYPRTPVDLSFMAAQASVMTLLPPLYVVMIPGCSPAHPYKRWSAARYAELARRLAEHGVATVLVGTQAEADALLEIAANSPSTINLLNRSKIMDIPSIVLGGIATVGNDTGPMHIASLCHKRTIGIYCAKTADSKMYGQDTIQLVGDPIDMVTVDDVWAHLSGLVG